MNKIQTFSTYIGQKILYTFPNPKDEKTRVYNLDPYFLYQILSGAVDINYCQLILKSIYDINAEQKLELCKIIPLEKEDLEVFTGGTIHLATLENIADIIDWLIKNGFAYTDKLFENCIAVKEVKINKTKNEIKGN